MAFLGFTGIEGAPEEPPEKHRIFNLAGQHLA